MTQDKKNKPVRVQFGKEMDNRAILNAINETQDRWAKNNPEKAHRLYPKTYDAQGNRIPR